MKKTVNTLAILAVAGLVSFAPVAYAQTLTDLTDDEIKMIEMKREKKEKHKAMMREKLGLTEEQQNKLEAHRLAYREQGKQYKKSLKELKEQMKLELEKDEIDAEQIRSINEQIKTIKNEMADHRLEGILEVRRILTAEQYEKFQEFKDQGRAKRRGKDKGRHGDFKKHHERSID